MPVQWTSLSVSAYNSVALMLTFQPGKFGQALLLTVLITISAAASACTSPMPSPGPDVIDAPQPPAGPTPAATQADQAPAIMTESNRTVPAVTSAIGSPVQIKLIHYRGTLTRIGCCNAGLYERDEFVVIQNLSKTDQDITGWRLSNITRGYPTFLFPTYYPCVPYDLPVELLAEESTIEGSYYSVTKNPAQSEANRFLTGSLQPEQSYVPNSEISWSSCTPLEPLDQTPMKPASGRQGLPVPCILYPGQTVLVFTDEVHCQTGGFSFNWGQGNIWNNEIADTAVLYNAAGEEVSRRSYLVGR